jgi:hypothetical protein
MQDNEQSEAKAAIAAFRDPTARPQHGRWLRLRLWFLERYLLTLDYLYTAAGRRFSVIASPYDKLMFGLKIGKVSEQEFAEMVEMSDRIKEAFTEAVAIRAAEAQEYKA